MIDVAVVAVAPDPPSDAPTTQVPIYLDIIVDLDTVVPSPRTKYEEVLFTTFEIAPAFANNAPDNTPTLNELALNALAMETKDPESVIDELVNPVEDCHFGIVPAVPVPVTVPFVGVVQDSDPGVAPAVNTFPANRYAHCRRSKRNSRPNLQEKQPPMEQLEVQNGVF